jgi:ferredoxin
MAYHSITLLDTQETFRCPDTRSVLQGMETLGRRGIPVGCRGGGCGVCKVAIISGTYLAEEMSRDHVSAEDLAAGRVLACQVRPTSDLTLKVLGTFKARLLGPPDSTQNNHAANATTQGS